MVHLQLGLENTFPLLVFGLLVFTIIFSAQAQQNENTTTLNGQVLNEEGEPLHLVHVRIKDTANGDVTDENGRFQLQVEGSDSVTVIASMVGYESAKKVVKLSTGERIELNFRISRDRESLEETTITANAFTTGNVEGVTLSPTEVVTTPGAAADIFRAIKTFPGVSNVDEGSGLFVRGGDVSEVAFLLDQAPVVHPYKYESPTGGVFGTIPPFLVSGTHFSTGGFSAKYGNAMSAVLSMESKGMPSSTQFDTNIGMAALSAGGAIPVSQNNFGIRFSGNRSLTRFMFKVNGQEDEFEQVPMGADANLSLIAKPFKGTTIKFFNYLNSSRVGARVPQPSFEGIYQSEEQNQLHNLQWKQLWRSWFLKTSISLNQYQNDQQLGGLSLNESDRTYKFRSDLEFSGWGNMTLFAGIEGGQFGNKLTGQLPVDDDILDPAADFHPLDEQYATRRFGGYLESEYSFLPYLEIRGGVRTDYENIAEEWTVDPRLSLQIQPTDYSNIRLATGQYQQFAEPFQYNSATGNRELQAQQAWHYIAGYEFKKDLFHIRAEGYCKSYDDLIIEDERQNISNAGYGEAYGLDFFFKYSDYLRTPFNGWISYSLLRSKRLHPRKTADGIIYEYAPSAFDITHNLNVVAKAQLINMLTGGVTYRYSTGRPFTPVSGARETSENYYLPIEGSIHSQRLPHFHRLDLNLSYYWAASQYWTVIFYASVSNVLDRQNVMDYTYNNDYSERSPVFSDHSRFYYAGLTLNLEL